MNMEKARIRLEKALKNKDRYSELPNLAKKLRDEGMKQIDMYFLFCEFQQILDPESLEYDSIVETLDLIWGGPCAKEYKLYDHELTNDEINKYS